MSARNGGGGEAKNGREATEATEATNVTAPRVVMTVSTTVSTRSGGRGTESQGAHCSILSRRFFVVVIFLAKVQLPLPLGVQDSKTMGECKICKGPWQELSPSGEPIDVLGSVCLQCLRSAARRATAAAPVASAAPPAPLPASTSGSDLVELATAATKWGALYEQIAIEHSNLARAVPDFSRVPAPFRPARLPSHRLLCAHPFVWSGRRRPHRSQAELHAYVSNT